MAVSDFAVWMDKFSCLGALWYAKRLSGNDTLATGSHQAGLYFPRKVLLDILPVLNRPDEENPDTRFSLRIDSHAGETQEVRAVWYNNHQRQGTRNETRLTGFGGRDSPLQDPESTGMIVVFAFVTDPENKATECRVWLCRSEAEEDLFAERLEPIEPGRWIVWSPDARSLAFAGSAPGRSCRLAKEDIPPDWLSPFPTGAQIVAKSVEMCPGSGEQPDKRLLLRRDCEYDIFLSVEEAVETPHIQRGFTSIDQFVSRAHAILQRRKSRAGRSLELQTKGILLEEGLGEKKQFDYNLESEPGRRPDFLFPSKSCYSDPEFPSDRLRMLAVKTTCRDRWRQILNEAERINTKHLLTVQEGVSEGQFREMRQSGVQLVVPKPLWDSYPSEIHPELMTLETFIADVKSLDN